MHFDRLDSRLPTPLYAQIAERVRVAVAAGELSTGDALPSVRVLATRLRVNPATVVQAYRDLEQEGIVEMRQGAGSFVADVGPERRARTRHAEARRLVRALLADAARRGLILDDVLRALDEETRTGDGR
jgi:GntR family transcriptional regulator